jgi:uncharacterized protein DUF1028
MRTNRGSRRIVATFPIVAFDPETEASGVAVQSKFLAIGALGYRRVLHDARRQVLAALGRR